MATDDSIRTVGEQAALQRILPRLKGADSTLLGPGDDSAVLATGPRTVITTDTMFEGGDFRLDWSSFADLGVKCVTTNLTDVAAMGATPTALVIALGVRAETQVSDLEAFADAVSGALSKQAPAAGVVGGDISLTDTMTIAVTALGDLEREQPVTRSGAAAGDALIAVGPLGLSGEGLRLLAGGMSAETLWRTHPELAQAHLAPLAEVSAGVTLARGGATAMLDVSDGLALDAHRLARASGVCIELFGDALAGYGVPLESVLFGGEDHALLAAVPADAVSELQEQLPDARLIGRVTAGEPAVLLDGAPVEERGWDPFRTQRPR